MATIIHNLNIKITGISGDQLPKYHPTLGLDGNQFMTFNGKHSEIRLELSVDDIAKILKEIYTETSAQIVGTINYSTYNCKEGNITGIFYINAKESRNIYTDIYHPVTINVS